MTPRDGDKNQKRLPNVGKLNQQSVQTLTDTLRADPALREQAIKLLKRDPLDFLNECFDVDSRVDDALRATLTKTNADVMARIYILIVENERGKISFKRTTGDPQVHFEMTATNMTPGGGGVVTAEKPKPKPTPGKPKPTPPPGNTEVEGTFHTRC